MKLEDIDLKLLDELIEKCEAKMASPFRKRKPEMLDSKEETVDLTEATSSEDVPSEEAGEDDEELKMLMELYSKLKD